MPQDLESATERTALLYHVANDRRLSQLQAEEQRHVEDAQSVISSAVRKEEQFMAESAVGERLPYNDYTTIDWLHDLVNKLIQLISTFLFDVFFICPSLELQSLD